MTTKTYTEAEVLDFVKAALAFGWRCCSVTNKGYPGDTLPECQEYYLDWLSANLAVANTVKES